MWPSYWIIESLFCLRALDSNIFLIFLILFSSRAIKTNPDVNPSTPWTNVMFNDFWGTPLTHSGSHKSYRPLCVLSFRFNHWLHELQPGGYHLVNVLLHCTATALFTILARSLLQQQQQGKGGGGSGWATASAGVLFASHPVHTEAVAGIVGRADVGAAIFFILAFLSYRRYAFIRSHLLGIDNCSAADPPPPPLHHQSASDKTMAQSEQRHNLVIGKWFWLVATLICATCSMLTKEHGVTVLAVCAVYDLFVHSKFKFRDILSSSSSFQVN